LLSGRGHTTGSLSPSATRICVVSHRVGIDKTTVSDWERNRDDAVVHLLPQVIHFLQYMPFSLGSSLPEQLRAYRQANGLSQTESALRLSVSECTIRQWESGRGNHPLYDLGFPPRLAATAPAP
jgi:transcriptional regulator with XRE-family HTH domain